MASKISFLDVEDLNDIKSYAQNRKIELVNNDIAEIDYYKEVISSIGDKPKNKRKLEGWNYWNQHYSKMDFNSLLSSPYFGSVKVTGNERVYIGKQGYYDISSHKLYVHDWRSNFGALFYSSKKHSFIEKRHVVIEEVREYVDKYIYFDKSDNLSYKEFLNKKLDTKKTQYLEDVIQTIDEIQNDILRDTSHKIQVIEGGPGTGKTTMGLHILSYLSYSFIKSHSKFPKICVVLQNDWFKKYIYKALKTLDLSGKNYHNTTLLSLKEFSYNNVFDYDYIYIDEAQDISDQDIIDFLLMVNKTVLNVIITVDPNQRIKDSEVFDIDSLLDSVHITYKKHKIERNYRNPEKIGRIANSLIKKSQEYLISKDASIFFSFFDRGLMDLDKLKDYIFSSNGQVAIIYHDSIPIESIKPIIDEAEIEYHIFETDMDLGNEKSVLINISNSKGLEFEKVVLFFNVEDFSIALERNMFVALTRTLGDIFIISNDLIHNLTGYEDIHPFNSDLQYSYELFKRDIKSYSLRVASKLSSRGFEKSVVDYVKSKSDVLKLRYLLFLHSESKAFSFASFKKQLSQIILLTDSEMIKLFHEADLVDYNELLMSYDLSKHDNMLNHIEAKIRQVLPSLSPVNAVKLFQYFDSYNLIKEIHNLNIKNLNYNKDLKQNILSSSKEYSNDYIDKCLDLGIFETYDVFLWGINNNPILSGYYFDNVFKSIIKDVERGNGKVIRYLISQEKTSLLYRYFLVRLRFNEIMKMRRQVKKIKSKWR